MVEHQRKVADIVRKDPAVAYINSTVGAGGPNSLPNSGRMLVALKPRDERGSLQSIIARLRQERQHRPRHRRSSSSRSRTSISAASWPRASINTRCSPTTPKRCIASRPNCATRSPSFRACSTSPPISTSRIRRSRSRSTAKSRWSTASPSTRCARSSTTPSARARSPPSTRRPTIIRSSWRPSRNSRAARTISTRSI